MYRKTSRSKRPPPSKSQIAKGALASMALAIPIGAVGAFGLSAADAYTASTGKGWSPPIIGWRGAVGLVTMAGGAVFRSPVFVGVGAVLFGSSIPQMTRELGAAITNEGEPSHFLTAAGDYDGLPDLSSAGYDDDDYDYLGEDSAFFGYDDDLEDAFAGTLHDLGDGLE